MKRTRFSVALVVCLSVAAASCGSDDEGASETAAPTTTAASSTSAAPTTDAPATTGAQTTDAPASDEPIVIATFTPEDAATGANQPGIRPAMEAIIEDINAKGGVHGQQIEFLWCNHQSDANVLAQCAEEAISEKATALVSPYANLPTHLPILSAAGIPIIDAVATNPAVLADPNIFVISPGAPGLSLGLSAAAVEDRGWKNVSIVASEIPATVPATKAFIAGLTAHGGTVATQVNVAATLTDLASVVVQAENADAVFLLLPPAQVLSYLQAAKQSGSDTPIIGASAALLQQTHIDQTGGADSPAEGALIGNLFPSSDSPVWDEFKAVVDAYDGNTDAVDFNNSGVQGAWAAMQVFLSVADLIEGEINAESFVDALHRADAVDTGGIMPLLDFTKPFITGYTSLYNRTANLGEVVDGKLVNSDIEPIDTSDDFDLLTPS